ncbi:hypothetical protein [Brucella sp. IR073]
MVMLIIFTPFEGEALACAGVAHLRQRAGAGSRRLLLPLSTL